MAAVGVWWTVLTLLKANLCFSGTLAVPGDVVLGLQPLLRVAVNY
jgi:hypothetical protein